MTDFVFVGAQNESAGWDVQGTSILDNVDDDERYSSNHRLVVANLLWTV